MTFIDNQSEVLNAIKVHGDNNGETFYQNVRDQLKINGCDFKKLNNTKRTLGQLVSKKKIEFNNETNKIKDLTHSVNTQ